MIKFHTAVKQYLEWKATYTATAFKMYKSPLKHLTDYFGADREITSITLTELNTFHISLQKTNSPGNVRNIMTISKNFFEFYSGQNYNLAFNPLQVRTPKILLNSHLAVMPDDFERMNESIGESTFSDLSKKLLINLLHDTGMRIGEALSLNTTDINLGERIAVVRTEKSKQLRYIMWSEPTSLIMKKYLGIRLCINQRPALFIASNIGGRNDRLCIRTSQRWIKEVARQAGLTKKLSPHSFRHGKVHELAGEGADYYHIAKIVGHTDPKSTLKNYMVFNKTEFIQIADQFLRH